MSENKLPQHIGIIMDGNRRWARSQNLPTLEGHKVGYDKVKDIAEHAFSSGVKILSVYAFSTENWKRSAEEVGYLMDLLKVLLNKDSIYLAKNGVKLNILGSRDRFDESMRQAIVAAEKNTQLGDKGILNICVNYGGREEIVEAIKKIVDSKIKPEQIDQVLVASHLYTAGLPDPDLIIRTSGEQRLSGFLTWQSVYSELYFVNKHWPDFSKADLDLALAEFVKRQRRFGGN